MNEAHRYTLDLDAVTQRLATEEGDEGDVTVRVNENGESKVWHLSVEKVTMPDGVNVLVATDRGELDV